MYIIENISYNQNGGSIIKSIELYYSDIIITIDDKTKFCIMTNYDIVNYTRIKTTTFNTLNDCNKVLIKNGYEALKKNNIKISNSPTTYEYIHTSYNPEFIKTNKYVDEIKTLLPEFIDTIFN
jgi:hypothetical protein